MTYSNSHALRVLRHKRLVTRSFGWLLLFWLFWAMPAHSQAIGVRWDLGTPGSAGVVMVTGGSGYPPIYAVPNVTLHFCSYPANAVPCTNYVTTYTSLTLGSSCAPSAQVVLQGSSTCQATSASDGSMGVYLAAGGTYTYNLIVNGVSSPTYTVTIPGAPGQAVTPVTTPISCPGSTLFPITSESQAFAVTLTGDCTASSLTAVAAIVPPAQVTFQIVSNGHLFTWPSNSIGGATVAATGTTTQTFTWDGVNATATASANLGTGPIQRAGTFDATSGYQVNGAFGTSGYCLESTGSGSVYAPCIPNLVIANASVTGTILNGATRLTGAPSTAIRAATTDTSGIVGITVSGAGTTGNATIQQTGNAVAIFDGGTVAGDYVIPSTTVNGAFHDSGVGPPSAPPQNATQVIGQVLSTHVGAGSYTMNLYGPGHFFPPLQGTDPKLLTAGTYTGATGIPVCKSANSGATTAGCSFPTLPSGVGAPQKVSLGSPITLVANTFTAILTETVTFPSAAGTYRADARYGAWITAGNNACAAEVVDTTNNRAFALSGQDANGTGYIALAGSEISSATYAASDTPTFRLKIICNSIQDVTVGSDLFTISPQESTYLSVTPILSN